MKLLNYILAFDYSKYFIMMVRTLLILLFFKLVKLIIIFITSKWLKRSKTRFVFHQTLNIIINIICVIFLFLLWLPYLKNVLTIISFISAGITIAIRDIILNLFAGFYIKTRKPFNHVKKEINNYLRSIESATLKYLNIAYIPNWAVGIGDKEVDKITKVIEDIRKYMNRKYKINPEIYYGGNIENGNIKEIIDICDGVILDKASTDAKLLKELLKEL